MIDMQPSPEQQQIIDSIHSWLNDNLPYERFRPDPQPVPNRDRDRWAALGELGVFGIGVSEEQGGIGYGLIEEVLVARELGRYLVSPAALSTMVAVHVAAALGRRDLVDALVAGSVVVAPALGLTPESGSAAGDYHLIDADGVELTLVVTQAGAGLVAASEWQDRREIDSIDTSLVLERARLAKPESWVEDASIARRAHLLVSAFMAGMAEAALEDSVGYSNIREQFGQPIGAFQAMQHRCADMVARASAAWNLTIFAALAEVDGAADAQFQICAARVIAADCAFKNGAVNIQNHGGIGFTGEHFAHLFVKRTHVLDRFDGDIFVQKKRLLAATPPSFEDAA